MKTLTLKLKATPTGVKTARVDVIVTGFEEMGAFNASIGYDPTMLKLTSRPTQLTCKVGTIGNDNTQPGLLKMGWFTYPELTLQDGDVLLSFDVEALQNGTSRVQFLPDEGFWKIDFSTSPETIYEGTDVTFGVVETPAAKPLFPAKAKVSEKKAIMGYTSKKRKDVSQRCSNCKSISGKKCKIGGFATAAGAICKHYQR